MTLRENMVKGKNSASQYLVFTHVIHILSIDIELLAMVKVQRHLGRRTRRIG